MQPNAAKASYENVAESMRKHTETVTEHLRVAQDEVKAHSVRLAHAEEQLAFHRHQHQLEMKELEDEYAKQAWQADKVVDKNGFVYTHI